MADINIFGTVAYGVDIRRKTDVVMPGTHGFASPGYGNIGGSQTNIVNGNDKRISAMIRNTHTFAGSLYIALGTAARTDTGFPLGEGDAYEINQINLFKGTVWAVSSGTVAVRAFQF